MSEFEDDRCPGGQDEADQSEAWRQEAWREVYGHGYVRNLGALHDQALTAEALDAACPLEGRWPDPRALGQTAHWWMPDGERLDLARLGPADAAWLLRWLVELAPRLHATAARDEDLTTPSGVLTAMAAAGVPRVEQVEPVAWVQGTPLARLLARLAAP